MKIGVRAHDHGRDTIENMADLLQAETYSCVQLVFPKVFSEFGSYRDICRRDAEKVRKEFEKRGMEIAVFGCYQDLGNPDPDIRKNAVDTFLYCMPLAKEAGAAVIGSETAYPHLSAEEKKVWYPSMMDSLERLTEEAVRLDMKIAIEPVYWHPCESMEAADRVLGQLGEKEHVRMIFDMANVLEFPESTDQDACWTEWLGRFGDRIEAMHIKDFVYGPEKEYIPKPLGEGCIRFDAAAAWVKANRPDMYLIREEMDPAHAQEDRAFMRRVFGQETGTAGNRAGKPRIRGGQEEKWT